MRLAAAPPRSASEKCGLPNWVSLINLFLLERREGDRKRNIDVEEKHQLVASHMPPTADQVSNPHLHPDRESNWQPFGSQADAQPTEPHQPGLPTCFTVLGMEVPAAL